MLAFFPNFTKLVLNTRRFHQGFYCSSAFPFFRKCLNTGWKRIDISLGVVPRIPTIRNRDKTFEYRAHLVALHRSHRILATGIKKNWHGIVEIGYDPLLLRGEVNYSENSVDSFWTGPFSLGSSLAGTPGAQVTRRRSLVFSYFNFRAGTFAPTILNTVSHRAPAARIKCFDEMF